jgi:hypothetical protein
MDTWRNGDIRHGDIKQKMEAQAIFLNPFTVRYLCKWKFIVFWFVEKETNGSYTFAKRLNRLAHLL